VYLRMGLIGVHVDVNPDGEELHVMNAHQATGAWNANVSRVLIGRMEGADDSMYWRMYTMR
jgi:hypothetical protein